MQDGALLGDVDLLAPKHGVDAGPQAGFLRKLHKESERLIRDAVLRVVEVDTSGLGRQALPAFRVVCEEFSEMQVLYVPEMGFEGLPRGTFRKRHGTGCHAHVLSIVVLYWPRRAARLHLAR